MDVEELIRISIKLLDWEKALLYVERGLSSVDPKTDLDGWAKLNRGGLRIWSELELKPQIHQLQEQLNEAFVTRDIGLPSEPQGDGLIDALMTAASRK